MSPFPSPQRTVELAIFDCDGVLVDSDQIALRIQAREITRLGLPMSVDECSRAFLGIGMPATLTRLEAMLGTTIPPGWEHHLERLVYAAFEKELKPVSGIIEALDRLPIPVCVASSGSHQKMRLTLGLTGLHDRFANRIFSATEVKNGKPAPDLFLHAARSLAVQPDRCIVVEDSPAGAQAARAAGMPVFAYAATTPAEWLDGPDTVVFDDMRQLPDLLAAHS